MTLSRGREDGLRILVLDADPVARRLLQTGLEREPAVESVDFVDTLSAARQSARATPYDLVIADLVTLQAPDALGDIARVLPSAVLFAMTDRGTVSGAVEALREGAHDFLVKPVSVTALLERFAACDRRRRLAQGETATARVDAEQTKGAVTRFIGSSPVMAGLYDQIRRMASSRAPVFITGESGAGKELCAEAVHGNSGRAEGPFIAINCSAIPRDLMESEIFGHQRGAFTGAVDDRPGAAELADGGTLFLDEIGDMDLGLQAKLLRFIQTGTVRRLGDTRARTVDVRFVAATNRDIVGEVRAGHFREDLYYRLHVLPVHVPPLRARAEDIVPLARHFLSRFCAEEGRAFEGFTPAAERCLLSYDWPGNVRQLENVIRRVVVLYDGDRVEPSMLPGDILEPSASVADDAAAAVRGSFLRAPAPLSGIVTPFWKQERRIIEAALDAFDGNISRAAAALEIAPSTIYRKRQSWMERGA